MRHDRSTAQPGLTERPHSAGRNAIGRAADRPAARGQQVRRPAASLARSTCHAALSTRARNQLVVAANDAMALAIALAWSTWLRTIMSPPASRNRMARVAGESRATAVAPRLSDMTTPRNPRSPRSIPLMTVFEKTARSCGSIWVYVASEIITNGTRDATARANGWRYGSWRVVTVSTTALVKSVLPSTRPRPGKCFAVVPTPAARIPAMKAATWLATVAGSCPYSRSSSPIGAFWSSVPGGTTSATGARSRLTPAVLSSRPQVVAAACSWSGDMLPCVRADGTTAKPDPESVWTSPPSWFAATKKGTPCVADCVAWDWTASETARTAASPVLVRFVNRTDPKWYLPMAARRVTLS